VNKLTNSIVHINPLAREEAKKIDELIRVTTDKKKLEQLTFLGVPFTAKDSVCIQGCKVTVGLVCRANEYSDHDTDVVIQLRNAGAIPIAITNTPELLLWWDAENKLTGRTCNPYDLSRIPGGSTGGCATLVASAASILSVASDIGGSTRIPASFCGLFGHKTTSEVISSKGKYPEIDDAKLHLFSFGPICRYAKDLRPSIAAMAGKSAISAKLPKLHETPAISTLRVFYMDDDGDAFKTSVSHEIKAAIQDVVEHLAERHQVEAVRLDLQDFGYALDMWRATLEKLR
jgi:fatty acid amide hydrolase 2